MDREVAGDLHFGAKRIDNSPLIVFVHGVMDRGATFLGVARGLPRMSWIIYDRRGYGRSVSTLAPSFFDHVNDLVEIIDREALARPIFIVGQSLGGTIALAAASRRPDSVAAVLVHEPPLPWLDWWPTRDEDGRRIEDDDLETAVVRVMQRLIGPDGWDALPPAAQARRLTEGPALVAELVSVRDGCPFEPNTMTMPCIISRGSLSAGHRERAQQWLTSVLPGASSIVLPGVGHNVQKSHPDQLRRCIEDMVNGVGHPSIS